MKINRLELQNFRNIAALDLTFDDGVQLIIGKNAQGKTNILESIFLSSTMKSFRTNKENMLLRYGQSEANIRLTFAENGREHILEIKLSENQKKKVFLDEKKLEKMRDAIGVFQSVLFTPDHLMMIKGAPGERREFLDMALCAQSPSYTENLLQYSKALKNRNRILKSGDETLMAVLPVWDETLCKYGAAVAFDRQEYIKRLDAAAQTEYSAISDGAEQMKIVYLNQFSKDSLTKREYFDKMLASLEQHRAKDIEEGSTSYGAHKDDFLTLIAGKSAKFFASQGQIRSTVLALKLAEAHLIEQNCGQKPVILLDDILSELDPARQDYILRHTFDNQCFVSTCEPDKLAACKGTKYYIEKGAWIDVPASGR